MEAATLVARLWYWNSAGWLFRVSSPNQSLTPWHSYRQHYNNPYLEVSLLSMVSHSFASQ